MHTQSRNDPLCPDTEKIFNFQVTKQFNSVLEIKRAQSINTEGKKKTIYTNTLHTASCKFLA